MEKNCGHELRDMWKNYNQ